MGQSINVSVGLLLHLGARYICWTAVAPCVCKVYLLDCCCTLGRVIYVFVGLLEGYKLSRSFAVQKFRNKDVRKAKYNLELTASTSSLSAGLKYDPPSFQRAAIP